MAAEMKLHRTQAENLAQLEAFQRIEGNELELISRYAADFRKIIIDFEAAQNGNVPSADDLLWIASEHLGYDITKAA